MENSQGRRPTRVGRFGNMHINYSRTNESTQHVEGTIPRAVRVLRTIRVGLSTPAKGSTLRTNTSTTKSKEASFQIAELFYRSPDPRDVGYGADHTNWFRLHCCNAYPVAAVLNFNSFNLRSWNLERAAN